MTSAPPSPNKFPAWLHILKRQCSYQNGLKHRHSKLHSRTLPTAVMYVTLVFSCVGLGPSHTVCFLVGLEFEVPTLIACVWYLFSTEGYQIQGLVSMANRCDFRNQAGWQTCRSYVTCRPAHMRASLKMSFVVAALKPLVLEALIYAMWVRRPCLL